MGWWRARSLPFKFNLCIIQHETKHIDAPGPSISAWISAMLSECSCSSWMPVVLWWVDLRNVNIRPSPSVPWNKSTDTHRQASRRPPQNQSAPGAGFRASSWISRAILVMTCGDRFSYELMV